MKNNSITFSLIKSWILRWETFLPVFAFSVPFFFNGSQILTGSMVNAFLFIASQKNFKSKEIYFISFLPSIGAIFNGLIFGKFTLFLLFFMPSIFISNLLLIKSFTKFKNIIFSSFLKTSILYLTALVLVSGQIVPKIFLTAMGILQLVTALIGGSMMIALFKIARKKI